MKLEEWNNIYTNHVRWIIRSISYLSEYEEYKKNSFVTSLVWLQDFERDLLEDIENVQWFNLCHKYINKAREINDSIIGRIFFELWTGYTDDYSSIVHSYGLADFIKDATEQEIEQANKDFSCYDESKHTFTKGKVLEYRDIRLPIDDQWNDAWLKKKNGEIIHFQLIWDWWFPIDEYLDLELDWKDTEMFREDNDKIWSFLTYICSVIKFNRSDVEYIWSKFSTEEYCASYLVTTDYYLMEFVEWLKERGDVNL